MLVCDELEKRLATAAEPVDHARAIGKAMRDLPQTSKDPDPDRCPGCGASYALVGRIHRCRGG